MHGSHFFGVQIRAPLLGLNRNLCIVPLLTRGRIRHSQPQLACPYKHSTGYNTSQVRQPWHSTGITTLKNQYSWENYILVLRTIKYCYQTNATVWSSELYEYRWDSYTGISQRHIPPRRIQVRWYGNTMYSDHNQNIRPIIIFSSPTRLSLLWIFGCDKTIRDTQKWSFKQRKNPPEKSTTASKKCLEQMTLLSHFACEAMYRSRSKPV